MNENSENQVQNPEEQLPNTEETVIEEEIDSAMPEKNDKKEPKNKGFAFLASLIEYFEPLAIALGIALLVFAFCFRHCVVDGNSMNKTLIDKEVLITTNFMWEPEQGDIIVFHLVNDRYEQPLVKRMIADEGQDVLIDLTAKELYVDGKLIKEDYIYLDSGVYERIGYFDNTYLSKDQQGHYIFSVTVPEGHIFVMGDNRNHSTDSRSSFVSFVDKDCVLGKAIIRLNPFTVFD